jgi:aromatic ring-opening dioxygenase LigB subunit
MTSFEYFEVIVGAFAGGGIIALGLWVFYRAACRTDRNLNDELPYKVDAPKTESKSQKRIIITPTDVRIAKKLGLTLEQYARELIKINEKEASKPKRKYTKRSKYWNTGRR